MTLFELDAEIKTALIGFLSGLLGVFLVSFKKITDLVIEKWFARKLEANHEIIETLNTSKLIKDSLKNMLGNWSASRAFIIQFHNGGHFYTGKSMQKISIIYEECTPGVSPLHNVLQNIPISTCMYIQEIVEGIHMYEDINDIDDVLTKTFYTQFGVKSVIGAPLIANEKLLGVIIIHYVDHHNNFSSDSVQQLIYECKGLSLLVDNNSTKI